MFIRINHFVATARSVEELLEVVSVLLRPHKDERLVHFVRVDHSFEQQRLQQLDPLGECFG